MTKSAAERQADFRRRLMDAGGRRIPFDLDAKACEDLERIAESLPDLKKGELLAHVLAKYVATMK